MIAPMGEQSPSAQRHCPSPLISHPHPPTPTTNPLHPLHTTHSSTHSPLRPKLEVVEGQQQALATALVGLQADVTGQGATLQDVGKACTDLLQVGAAAGSNSCVHGGCTTAGMHYCSLGRTQARAGIFRELSCCPSNQ